MGPGDAAASPGLRSAGAGAAADLAVALGLALLMSTISPSVAHVGAASINQTVGDWAGNKRRIQAVIEEARSRGVRLLVLPEMCIPGYSLGDRLLRRGTLDRSWRMLEDLTSFTGGMRKPSW